MTVPSPDENCVPLRVPWPMPEDQGDPDKMSENWKAVEQWTSYMIRNCLCHNCGGGG